MNGREEFGPFVAERSTNHDGEAPAVSIPT